MAAVAARPEGAIELLRATLEAAPAPVTIVAVGPLTNIALLLRTHPGLAERIASLRIMGGAIAEGNTTASAEFNIWQDPEAARIVFDCGRPISLMPLDVTHQALFRAADVERLEALGTRPGRVFADLLRFFGRFHRERYGWDGSPIHDAVAVGHLALPDLVRTEAYRVDVETTSELTRGRTVVDLHGLTGCRRTSTSGVAIDRDRFIDVLVEAVAAMALEPRDRGSGEGRSAAPLRRPRGFLHDRHVDRGGRPVARAPRGERARAGAGRESRGERLHLGRRHPGRAPGPGDLEPGFVSLLIGVNDVVQGVPIATYEANVVADPRRGARGVPAPIGRESRSRTTRSPRPAPTTATRASSTTGSWPATRRCCGWRPSAGSPFVDIFDISLEAATERKPRRRRRAAPECRPVRGDGSSGSCRSSPGCCGADRETRRLGSPGPSLGVGPADRVASGPSRAAATSSQLFGRGSASHSSRSIAIRTSSVKTPYWNQAWRNRPSSTKPALR